MCIYLFIHVFIYLCIFWVILSILCKKKNSKPHMDRIVESHQAWDGSPFSGRRYR